MIMQFVYGFDFSSHDNMGALVTFDRDQRLCVDVRQFMVGDIHDVYRNLYSAAQVRPPEQIFMDATAEQDKVIETLTRSNYPVYGVILTRYRRDKVLAELNRSVFGDPMLYGSYVYQVQQSILSYEITDSGHFKYSVPGVPKNHLAMSAALALFGLNTSGFEWTKQYG